MVANISTRGSSEGLLGVLVAALLWATLTRKPVVAGLILGLAVHFKIYPFIYGVSILWWWDAERDGAQSAGSSTRSGLIARIIGFITPSRVKLTLAALVSFVALNLVMYLQYGTPFLQHTFFHHLTRIDHRHNFSPYSTLLYLSAAGGAETHFEALAFLPQLVLVVIALPLVLAKKSLTTAMLAQTFTFVTFNKVCTSQVSCIPKMIRMAADLSSISFGTSFCYHSTSLLPRLSAGQPWVSQLLYYGSLGR
jgi:phosphatidylinositol glycan class M